jgi:hypothetical protein
MADMALAIQHAKRYWSEICEDGTVVTKVKRIVIQDEYKNFKLDPSKWMAVFLKYETPDDKTTSSEGLFFVEKSDTRAALSVRKQTRFWVHNFDNRDGSRGWHFICSWRDAGKDNIEWGIEPLYTGLNDCAHFVSECLSKAGLAKVGSTDVGELVGNLRKAGAKTLCQLVDKDRARRIMQADILKPGDVIAFGTSDKKLHHSVLYLGDEQIAMHTYINHPDYDNNPNPVQRDPNTRKLRNWEMASNDSHPLVTIMHFPFEDKQLANSPRVGWWKVAWKGEEYYYYLYGDGRAGYVKNPPKTTKQPLISPQSTGFWFETGTNMVICWTSTGSVETFPLFPQFRMTGTIDGKWNDIDPLSAVRPKAY